MAGTPPVSDAHQHLLVSLLGWHIPGLPPSHFNRRNLSRASVDPKDTHLASLANHMSMARTPLVSDFRQHLLVYLFQLEHYRTFSSHLIQQFLYAFVNPKDMHSDTLTAHVK